MHRLHELPDLLYLLTSLLSSRASAGSEGTIPTGVDTHYDNADVWHTDPNIKFP